MMNSTPYIIKTRSQKFWYWVRYCAQPITQPLFAISWICLLLLAGIVWLIGSTTPGAHE